MVCLLQFKEEGPNHLNNNLVSKAYRKHPLKTVLLKHCLGIFTVGFSLLFSLRKFEKQTYFRKPRGEVFLINSSIWILRRNFKSVVNIGGISLMFETLITRSQMKNNEPAIDIKTFWYFIADSLPSILGDEFQATKYCSH